MQIKWGIFWENGVLQFNFFEGVSCYEVYGEVWSMEVAHDTIMNMGVML